MPMLAGSFMTMPTSEASMLELLRVLVGDLMMSESSKLSAREALKRSGISKTETKVAIARRVLLRYRTFSADHSRPHASEALNTWRFTTEDWL